MNHWVTRIWSSRTSSWNSFPIDPTDFRDRVFDNTVAKHADERMLIYPTVSVQTMMWWCD